MEFFAYFVIASLIIFAIFVSMSKRIIKNKKDFVEKKEKEMDDFYHFETPTGPTMTCPKCNTEMPKTNLYCDKCGKQLNKECFFCGSINSLDKNTCEKCGSKLS